jgi:hypothetical protein
VTKAAMPLDPEACRALVAGWAAAVVALESGCAVYGSGTRTDGYRRVQVAGRGAYVHRIALVAALNRDIAPGMQVGHKCHDEAAARGECRGGRSCPHRACVNPDHLYEQSEHDNWLASPHTPVGRAARLAETIANHKAARREQGVEFYHDDDYY